MAQLSAEKEAQTARCSTLSSMSNTTQQKAFNFTSQTTDERGVTNAFHQAFQAKYSELHDAWNAENPAPGVGAKYGTAEYAEQEKAWAARRAKLAAATLYEDAQAAVRAQGIPEYHYFTSTVWVAEASYGVKDARGRQLGQYAQIGKRSDSNEFVLYMGATRDGAGFGAMQSATGTFATLAEAEAAAEAKFAKLKRSVVSAAAKTGGIYLTGKALKAYKARAA